MLWWADLGKGPDGPDAVSLSRAGSRNELVCASWSEALAPTGVKLLGDPQAFVRGSVVASIHMVTTLLPGSDPNNPRLEDFPKPELTMEYVDEQPLNDNLPQS